MLQLIDRHNKQKNNYLIINENNKFADQLNFPLKEIDQK